MNVRVDSVKVVSERVSYDGQSVRRSAQCVIGDSTGSVVLVANDEQLNVVQQGAVITIRNANARVFQEHIRIEIDKWAKVEPSTAQIGAVNLDIKKNISATAYELVTVKN